jgi:hypothetical protein
LAACGCQLNLKKSFINLFEVAFDRNLQPCPPVLEKPSDIIGMPVGITIGEITAQLSQIAIQQIDVVEDDIDLSLIAADGLNKVLESIDLLLKRDGQLALQQAGESIKHRLHLAKLIIQPQYSEEERNEWFKAIGLASIACQALGYDPKGYSEVRTTKRVNKCYFKAMAGLLIHYSNTGKAPDWELLAQLMLNAIESQNTPGEQYDSIASVLYKALSLAGGSPLQRLALWKTKWSSRDATWAACPDSEKCPVTALHLLLDAIGPVKDWSQSGDDGFCLKTLGLLQSLAHFADELGLIVVNYFDTVRSGVTTPFPFHGRKGVNKDNVIFVAMDDCMSLCRQIKRATVMGIPQPEYPYTRRGFN